MRSKYEVRGVRPLARPFSLGVWAENPAAAQRLARQTYGQDIIIHAVVPR